MQLSSLVVPVKVLFLYIPRCDGDDVRDATFIDNSTGSKITCSFLNNILIEIKLLNCM